MNPESVTFEQAMARLDEIAQKLENTDTPLEETIALYEEGIRLADLCGKKLNAAKEKLEPREE